MDGEKSRRELLAVLQLLNEVAHGRNKSCFYTDDRAMIEPSQILQLGSQSNIR